MPTNDSPTVKFLCREEYTDRAPDPVVAARQFPRLLQNHVVNQKYSEAAQKDVQVTDAVTFGWYLYPAASMTVEYTEDTDNTSYTTSADLLTIEETPLKSLCLGTIDTLWHVTVPDEYVLFVTNPLYRPYGPVAPQVLTPQETPQHLEIPIQISPPTTIDKHVPIAQVIPISADTIHSDDVEVGIRPNSIQRDIQSRIELNKMYESPYKERIHTRKQSPDPVQPHDEQETH